MFAIVWWFELQRQIKLFILSGNPMICACAVCLTNPMRVMFHHMMWSYHKMFPNFSLDISFPVFLDAIDLNLADLSSGYLSPSTDAEVSYASDVLWPHKTARHWGLVQWHQPSDYEETAQHCFSHRSAFTLLRSTWNQIWSCL